MNEPRYISLRKEIKINTRYKPLCDTIGWRYERLVKKLNGFATLSKEEEVEIRVGLKKLNGGKIFCPTCGGQWEGNQS